MVPRFLLLSCYHIITLKCFTVKKVLTVPSNIHMFIHVFIHVFVHVVSAAVLSAETENPA